MSLATAAAGSSSQPTMTRTYQPPVGVYDEMYSAPGVLRPHWVQFAAALDAVGPVELSRRWEQARRLLHENGITYNVHGDPQGTTRPWELDPVPLLISSAEWQELSAGLIQRAKLLNRILADLYGPQELLKGGHIPADLIYPHPGFLRPAAHAQRPGQAYLQFCAHHLARSPSGQWWVVADRTQAPSGAGYAVENRIVVSRTLPLAFRDGQIERLASFFIQLRDTFNDLAAPREQPRIVLLSPGPKSPTYFEDAYLARYLGYTLVEGGDLAVRDGKVFLKTLGGLIGVDVIFRRVFSEACDPLELNGASLSGVPGLMQAVRSGTVKVANSIGSGLLESPAFMAFLPALCEHLLGESLRLPSVATWWCGEPAAMTYVMENIGQMVIRGTFVSGSTPPVFGSQLSATERAEWIAKIQSRPRDYVAQQHVQRSTAPVWTGNSLQPWHVGMRTFLVADGDSYQVMPGALTRTSLSTQQLGESMLSGQGSKDVWIVSDRPVANISLLHPSGQPVAIRRSGNDLPSRVADNFFWLGRHVERLEASARLLRSIVSRLTSESEPGGTPQLNTLLVALADQAQIRPEFFVLSTGGREPLVEREILAFIFDESRVGGLQSTLNAMHHVASIVRDRISLDSWRILNRAENDFTPIYPLGVMQLSDVLALLNQMILNLSAFSGLGMESMTRGPGWRFLDMGRRVERAVHTLGLLKSTLVAVSPDEESILDAILEIADSSMTYRNRYLTNLQCGPVLDLLLTDQTNPRSVLFQLAALETHVAALDRDKAQPLASPEERIILLATSSLRLAEIQTLVDPDRDAIRRPLERLIARQINHLRILSDSITHTYLVHAGPTRQLTEIRPGGGA